MLRSLLRTTTSGLLVVDLDAADWHQAPALAAAVRDLGPAVLVGTASSPLPPESLPLLTALTTTLAPGGPGRHWVPAHPDDLDRMTTTVARSPRAAAALASLLPVTAELDVPQGLVAESLAYSMLLAGPEFRAWRSAHPARPVPMAAEPVLLERAGDHLTVTLNRPERRNAFGRQVRDGLLAGLEVAALDPSVTEVVIRGNGPSFCSGGDLDEFGLAQDLAQAHLDRLRFSAGRILHGLRDKVRFELHGACIGAGIELPAFAGRVTARSDASFRLPELGMGLVPGAGGTVGIAHRIGRWRTAHLALTDRPVDATTALEWGLIDALS